MSLTSSVDSTDSHLTDEVLQEAMERLEPDKPKRSDRSRHYDSKEDEETYDKVPWPSSDRSARFDEQDEFETYGNYIGHDDHEHYDDFAERNAVSPQHDQCADHLHLPEIAYNNSMRRRNEKYYVPANDDFSCSATTNNQVIGEEEGTSQKLCWRSDPAESLSDWSLHVFNRSTKIYQVYHVHRVVMALGPRGCEYFQDVFRQAEAGTTASSASKTTRVPLVAEACKLVGCFLDYLYGNEEFEINCENALGICYLADFFRNHSLWDLATDFIEGDLETKAGREHLNQYYMDSIYYDQEEFLEHILAVCSLHLVPMFEEGISCTRLLEDVTPQHFLQVVGEIEHPTDEDSLASSSLALTRLVTEYCCIHQNELSMETFDKFAGRLTILDSSSALTLLELSLEFDFSPNEENGSSGTGDTVSSLILFQQKCIGSLSEGFQDILEFDRKRVTRIMRMLALREEHQIILVDWFQQTLLEASKQMRALRHETEKAQEQMRPLADRCQAMEEEVRAAHEKTAISQRNHNSTKSEMKTQISSWMRKNEGTNQQRQAEQQQWEHERLRLEMERQEWKHEKSRLKRELRAVRQELALQRGSVSVGSRDHSDDRSAYSSIRGREVIKDRSGHNRAYVIPNDCDSPVDDSRSYVTDSSSENNSMVYSVDGYRRPQDPHAYPLSNGMSPQFRIF